MPRTLTMGCSPGRPWVAEDLNEMPDDGFRREVIDGVLIVTTSPFIEHQVCVSGVAEALNDGCPEDMQIVPNSVWRPGNGDSFRPDLMVVRRQDVGLEDYVCKTPLLIVEILSRSSFKQDWFVKRDSYEALGVDSYWLVDPHVPRISALQLDEEQRFVEVADITADQPFQAALPFRVKIIPAELLGRDDAKRAGTYEDVPALPRV